MIASDNLYEIEISSAGKYLITDHKIKGNNLVIILSLIIGGVAFIIGIGVYVGIKKQYWFW